jgi:hypothetical protein
MNQRLDWRDWQRSEQDILWPTFGLGLAGLLSIWTQSEEHGHGIMVAAALLLGVIWLLTRMLPGRRSLVDVLSWEADTAPSSAPVARAAYRFPAYVPD